MPDAELGEVIREFYRHWSSEFYPVEAPSSQLEMFQ
jgi:hypothetical protein